MPKELKAIGIYDLIDRQSSIVEQIDCHRLFARIFQLLNLGLCLLFANWSFFIEIINNRPMG